MSPMMTILNEMRQHVSVAVYVGEVSLPRLADFLRGCEHALFTIGGCDDSFLAEFRDWIQQRFGSTKQGWEQLIVQHSRDATDAVAHFWKLVDEFRLQHPEYEKLATLAPVAPTAGAVLGHETASKSA